MRKARREERAEEKRELAAAEEAGQKTIKVTEFVTANELAKMMDVSVTEVISTFMSLGMFVSINQRLDAEALQVVAEEFGFAVEFVSADVPETINDGRRQSGRNLMPSCTNCYSHGTRRPW